MRDLVGLCSTMQALRGGQPFYLGCRMVGEILGLARMTANQHMLKLQHEGVLSLVEKHGSETRTATLP